MTDYCATCGQPYADGPMGARLRCCGQGYWTQHAPLPHDAIAARQLGMTLPAFKGYHLYAFVPGARVITAPLPEWV